MIMRRGQPLLLPVSPLFIAVSLIVALLLNMFLSNLLGPGGVWLPDFLAVALVFWNVHQPRRISIGWAFFFGLLMDVHASALLGQHALAYSVLSYFAISMHRRLRWFPVDGQALQLIPLLLVAHLLQWLVRWLATRLARVDRPRTRGGFMAHCHRSPVGPPTAGTQPR